MALFPQPPGVGTPILISPCISPPASARRNWRHSWPKSSLSIRPVACKPPIIVLLLPPAMAIRRSSPSRRPWPPIRPGPGRLANWRPWPSLGRGLCCGVFARQPATVLLNMCSACASNWRGSGLRPPPSRWPILPPRWVTRISVHFANYSSELLACHRRPTAKNSLHLCQGDDCDRGICWRKKPLSNRSNSHYLSPLRASFFLRL